VKSVGFGGNKAPAARIRGGEYPHQRGPRPLLRIQPQRPRHRCCRGGTNQPQQSTPSHSMTSSARSNTVCGIVSPSVLAVSRLMTSSKRVDCTTGKSAGAAPFRMRPA